MPRVPLGDFTQPFQAYALVAGLLVMAEIDFDCYQPVLAHRLTSIMEQSINYHYHVESPMCEVCKGLESLG